MAGCTSHTSTTAKSATTADPTTATTSVPTTTTTLTTDASVLDAYRRYWATMNTYGAASAPFDPQVFKQTFDPVATGAQYETLFNLFQLDRIKGWVFKGREGGELRPRVTERSADRAVIDDCADDFGGIFDTKNNVFVEPLTPGQHTHITAVLRLVDRTWKVQTQGGGDERCTV
jgi:hypothetical protein